MPADSPCAPLPVMTNRSWSGRDGSLSWTYTIGFDLAGMPVRFDIERPDGKVPDHEGPQNGLRPLVQGWRTAEGEWYGMYRCATGYATARLSPEEVEAIETAAKMALLG
ncbi:hypothetical protein [Azospirillum sp. sgz302134]